VKGKHYLMKVALFRGTGPLIVGGIIAGGGVCIMHYIGMIAIHAGVKIHWNGGVVFASVLIAIVAATAAFWILFRMLALYPAYESLRFLSSLVAAIAVCGMHYTGMMAASYTVDHDAPPAIFGLTMAQMTANTTALTLGILISWVSSIILQAELRTWHVYLFGRLKAARKVLGSLHDQNESDPVLHMYESKNNKITSTFEVARDFAGGSVKVLSSGKAMSSVVSMGEAQVMPEEQVMGMNKDVETEEEVEMV
jgi:hypothetical protein